MVGWGYMATLYRKIIWQRYMATLFGNTNSLVHFTYVSDCIVCISNGFLYLIRFIVTHEICIFVTIVPISVPSLTK